MWKWIAGLIFCMVIFATESVAILPQTHRSIDRHGVDLDVMGRACVSWRTTSVESPRVDCRGMTRNGYHNPALLNGVICPDECRIYACYRPDQFTTRALPSDPVGRDSISWKGKPAPTEKELPLLRISSGKCPEGRQHVGQRENSDSGSSQPKLYIFAVGINAYANIDNTLLYAVNDAVAFVELFRSQQGLLYSEVEVRLLTDSAATYDGILEGLRWLQDMTEDNSVAMIFLAGHGIQIDDDEPEFAFLPSDYALLRGQHPILSASRIRKTIRRLKGKTLIFVDACYAGGIYSGSRATPPDISQFADDLRLAGNGAVVFAATTGRQLAIENASWRHGAFTAALLEGLSGVGETCPTGVVTVLRLGAFVYERVRQMTDLKQRPTFVTPSQGIEDFPVTVVNQNSGVTRRSRKSLH